jgi:hypothetical protein
MVDLKYRYEHEGKRNGNKREKIFVKCNDNPFNICPQREREREKKQTNLNKNAVISFHHYYVLPKN